LVGRGSRTAEHFLGVWERVDFGDNDSHHLSVPVPADWRCKYRLA
jgi:hypothetical protein